MNLLIDTHALIWFLNGDDLISNNAKAAIEILTTQKLLVLPQYGKLRLK
jgi:PIN domain nuclease of toxin-antitoxin system